MSTAPRPTTLPSRLSPANSDIHKQIVFFPAYKLRHRAEKRWIRNRWRRQCTNVYKFMHMDETVEIFLLVIVVIHVTEFSRQAPERASTSPL